MREERKRAIFLFVALYEHFFKIKHFFNILFAFVVTLIGQILLTGIQLVVITYGSSLISY